ncbi:unnamed protein product, partial [Amoebophrya sp. A120]
ASGGHQPASAASTSQQRTSASASAEAGNTQPARITSSQQRTTTASGPGHREVETSSRLHDHAAPQDEAKKLITNGLGLLLFLIREAAPYFELEVDVDEDMDEHASWMEQLEGRDTGSIGGKNAKTREEVLASAQDAEFEGRNDVELDAQATSSAAKFVDLNLPSPLIVRAPPTPPPLVETEDNMEHKGADADPSSSRGAANEREGHKAAQEPDRKHAAEGKSPTNRKKLRRKAVDLFCPSLVSQFHSAERFQEYLSRGTRSQQVTTLGGQDQEHKVDPTSSGGLQVVSAAAGAPGGEMSSSRTTTYADVVRRLNDPLSASQEEQTQPLLAMNMGRVTDPASMWGENFSNNDAAYEGSDYIPPQDSAATSTLQHDEDNPTNSYGKRQAGLSRVHSTTASRGTNVVLHTDHDRHHLSPEVSVPERYAYLLKSDRLQEIQEMFSSCFRNYHALSAKKHLFEILCESGLIALCNQNGLVTMHAEKPPVEQQAAFGGSGKGGPGNNSASVLGLGAGPGKGGKYLGIAANSSTSGGGMMSATGEQSGIASATSATTSKGGGAAAEGKGQQGSLGYKGGVGGNVYNASNIGSSYAAWPPSTAGENSQGGTSSATARASNTTPDASTAAASATTTTLAVYNNPSMLAQHAGANSMIVQRSATRSDDVSDMAFYGASAASTRYQPSGSAGASFIWQPPAGAAAAAGGPWQPQLQQQMNLGVTADLSQTSAAGGRVMGPSAASGGGKGVNFPQQATWNTASSVTAAPVAAAA